MISLAALGICAALGMNLLAQFGLGLGLLAIEDSGPSHEEPGDKQHSLPGALILFAALFLLWVFFTYVLNPLGIGFYWYLLLYPISAALMRGLEWLFHRGFFQRGRFRKLLSRFTTPAFPAGWTELLPLGLLISLHLALSPLEALFLALCFSLGLHFSLVILRELHRRSRFEAIPPFLRGNPLALISLGLLSMIFISASIMLFQLP
jgi:Na+-translocating ferredoxin:NAD+ oxidoreductase RnfA subunit